MKTLKNVTHFIAKCLSSSRLVKEGSREDLLSFRSMLITLLVISVPWLFLC